MNPTVKTFLIYLAKNAVNAALGAIVPVWQNYATYNLATLQGWIHVGYIVLGAVGAREFVILYPKLMAWSKTNGVDQ